MVDRFTNYSRKHKFNGEFNFNGIDYEYVLYLPNFSDEEKEEIIQKFGNRMQNGKICLDVDEDTVRHMIDTGNISAYIIINEKDKDETASASIQIYNWCPKPRKKTYTAFINDLCRILGPSGIKNAVSPVNALMYFMEQLVAQNLNKNDIYLFVDGKDINNKTGLMSLYKNKYGFIENSDESPTLCPINKANIDENGNDNGNKFIVMRKPNLIADDSIISFSFLKKRTTTIGGKRKSRNKKGHRKTNKTVKKFNKFLGSIKNKLK